jgi:hypothetical protein
MLARRGIGHEHEPRHPRLKHDRVPRIQMHNDTLPDPANIRDSASNNAPPKPVNTRRNLYRPPPTRHPLHILNSRTDDPQDPPPHRLDFR